jgi:pimeloyl-ACP methyl ester carboxylesterase
MGIEVTTRDYVKGPAGTLHIVEEGSGGIPIVFAHSFLGNASHWQQQMNALRNTRRVVAFDFRSHGASEAPSKLNYSAEDLADDIAAVADELQLDQFVIVGHSMGGAAAVAYAGKNPQRVAGLVLAGTPGKSDPKQSGAIIASIESDAYQKVMDQYMNQLLEGATREVDMTVRKDVNKISRETSTAIIKALFEFDPLPILKDLKQPVLIISTVRENKQPQSLHNQLPDLPNKEFKHTSHWTQLDKPEEFNAALNDFLKRVEEKNR